MIEFMIPVPQYDNEGRALSWEKDEFLGELLHLFGGWTQQSNALGAWRNADGEVMYDYMTPVVFAVDEAQRDYVYDTLVPWVRSLFRQQAVYVRESTAKVSII